MHTHIKTPMDRRTARIRTIRTPHTAAVDIPTLTGLLVRPMAVRMPIHIVLRTHTARPIPTIARRTPIRTQHHRMAVPTPIPHRPIVAPAPIMVRIPTRTLVEVPMVPPRFIPIPALLPTTPTTITIPGQQCLRTSV